MFGLLCAGDWPRRLAVAVAAVALCTVGLWTAPSTAEAAAVATLDCRLRYSTGVQLQDSYGRPLPLGCGQTARFGNNGWLYVRDSSGPICIYFGSTLAGCAGIYSWAYIGNRPGQTATIRTQPTAT
jgi:hypothetical protein